MISAQPFAHANDSRQVSRALAALIVGVLALLAAFVMLVVVGTTARPSPLAGSALSRPSSGSDAVVKGGPACTAALQRARASTTLPSSEAIAADTAMLRACNPR